MKLGVFGLNISGGLTMSLAAKNKLDWNENVDVARKADEAGWEFLLPLGRWRGHGGPRNPNAEQYDTFTWAAGLAAVTSNIHVFSTCHVPIFHPMLAAKTSATIDNISGGRFGLNIVSGWNEREFGMFDVEQLSHDDRYVAAGEWLDVMERLWNEDGDVDHDGRFYRVKRGYLQPKPVQRPRPLVVSAGTSPAGLDFALTRADACFQGGPDWSFLEDTMKRTRERAAVLGQQKDLLSFSAVVVKDTEKEAQDYFHWYVDERGDFETANTLVDQVISGDVRSVSAETVRSFARAYVVGYGALPLVGTAEQVTEQLVRMNQTGYAGVALSWLDYGEGIDRFNAEVLPLMEEAGLRQPKQAAAGAPGE
jgi:alkanesulfonate monooxygenase SsuD/methylene tetrahydromethanopterin reductase-like flavin-dependent oxidoreductase (luciferase family)